MLNKRKCNTTHFNLYNIKYNIHLEINFFFFFFYIPKVVHTLQIFNPHSKNNIVQQKYNIHLEITYLHSKKSIYTSIQIQNNIVQQKYNIFRTHQMLSINIERVRANSRPIMTITTIIIHRFFVNVQIHNISHKFIQFYLCKFYAKIYIYIYIYKY